MFTLEGRSETPIQFVKEQGGQDQVQFLAQSNFTQGTVIAQQFDQDVMGDIGEGFQNFYDSGQMWALLIGVVIGYFIRSLTAY